MVSGQQSKLSVWLLSLHCSYCVGGRQVCREGYSLIAITCHLCIRPLGSSQYAWLDVCSVDVTHPSVCNRRVCLVGSITDHYQPSVGYKRLTTFETVEPFVGPVCKDHLHPCRIEVLIVFSLNWLILAS